jgi:hypothetical protein
MPQGPRSAGLAADIDGSGHAPKSLAVDFSGTAAMKARRLIDGASFGPDALKAIGEAFDEAWKTIEGNFGSNPQEVETARLKLANALLSVASHDSRDVEVLKRAALEVMARDYRSAIDPRKPFGG